MAGNFQCPQGQICSGEFSSKTSGSARSSTGVSGLYRTSTAVSQQSGGTAVTGGTTTLYKWQGVNNLTGVVTGNGSWVPVARTNNGTSWDLLKSSDGKQILSASEASSLTNQNGKLYQNTSTEVTRTLENSGISSKEEQKRVITPPDTSNPADTPPTGGDVNNQNGQDTTATSVNISGIANLDFKGVGQRGEYADYRYPLNEGTQSIDYIIFKAFKYGGRDVGGASGDIFSFKERDLKQEIKGSVRLPIQPSITDQNGVKWNEGTITPLQMGGANLSLGTINNGVEGAKAALSNALRTTQDGEVSSQIQNFVALYAAEQAVQTNLAARLTGAIVNPNLELLFDGPTLRPFTFNFKLSPRSIKEAEQVKGIIRFFKQTMAVVTTPKDLFLKAPCVYEISYFYQGKPHKGINKIKKCALQACSVDYTPDGSYMTFNEDFMEDGDNKSHSMFSYTLSLQFMELEPIYAKDYDDSSSEIGY
jgi:hypothetical protein